MLPSCSAPRESSTVETRPLHVLTWVNERYGDLTSIDEIAYQGGSVRLLPVSRPTGSDCLFSRIAMLGGDHFRGLAHQNTGALRAQIRVIREPSVVDWRMPRP
jgi:hypothetical protein